MLVEFDNLSESNPRAYQRVTQLIAHLMRNQFVHTEDRGSAPLLEVLARPESRRLIESYFDVAGYRLVHRESEGWAGILPDPERVALPRMRIDETLVLLVMRRLWEEELQHGEIHNNGTARLTVNEAYAAYQEIVAGSRRPGLGATDFRDVLRMLERRALVRLGDLDAEAQDMDLDIRALVATVAGDDFVASLESLAGRASLAPIVEDEMVGPGPDAEREPEPEPEPTNEPMSDELATVGDEEQ
ncbi:DUF4194 domain-containing protein [Sphingomonas colocasiae]|uniref:DUF4194 domain-containing protein n=1 Tax=Sphingomonas colocasiae TaxID=1848973 RepID=A0ABS7PTM8_9SPHN|nr:DUF4194 domain-containing protein [Sphingomonas colocasiae]MBY8823349.1 DUF4194 domain-containing protein [Sphingomonas colocasiae]